MNYVIPVQDPLALDLQEEDDTRRDTWLYLLDILTDNTIAAALLDEPGGPMASIVSCVLS